MHRLLPTCILVSVASLASGTVVTITNSGNNFVPNLVTISVGDTIRFQLTSSHDAREVSQATFDGNGNTPLPGGFQTAFGGGFVYPPQLGVGTHYYVCTPHAGQGMKGRIIVQDVGTGIADAGATDDMRLYPVPATGQVIVEGAERWAGRAWELFTPEGRLVQSGTLSGSRTILDVSTFTPGQYLLRVADDRRQVLRMVKE